jgi:hypothetical protein
MFFSDKEVDVISVISFQWQIIMHIHDVYKSSKI